MSARLFVEQGRGRAQLVFDVGAQKIASWFFVSKRQGREEVKRAMQMELIDRQECREINQRIARTRLPEVDPPAEGRCTREQVRDCAARHRRAPR
jgi:hypothetical protein